MADDPEYAVLMSESDAGEIEALRRRERARVEAEFAGLLVWGLYRIVTQITVGRIVHKSVDNAVDNGDNFDDRLHQQFFPDLVLTTHPATT